MLQMINLVFPIWVFMVSSSRWGSDIASTDDGCLEKIIDLWMKMSNPLPWPWGRSLRTVVYFRMQGFLYFDERVDSCITTTLTLFLSSTTPRSVSLLPIPVALSCRMLNMLSSLICSADGAGVGGGEGGGGVDCWVFEAEQGCRSNLYFSDTVLHLRVRNISHAQNYW